MKHMFGPENEHERLVFAVEELLADVQLKIQEAMVIRGVNRSELARRLGCSAANVTQLLSEGANLKLDTIARVFHSLDDTCEFRSRLVEKSRRERAAKNRDALERRPDWNVRVRKAALEPQGAARDDATSELIMMIAKKAARRPRQRPCNTNVLRGDKAA